MVAEIGGYFGLEHFSGREYHEGLLALNSGRNALLYLLRARKIEKLYIPYFLCDSVSALCDRYGYAYEYYRIAPDFTPVFPRRCEGGEYLYIVNFFGKFDAAQAAAWQAEYGNIIFDNVHAFFQRPAAGIDTLYSCRKFFGVPDGAYLATDAKLEEEIPVDVSMDRMRHVLGRLEGCATDYYADFKASDEAFDRMPLAQMSKLTRNILGAVDYEAVRRKRNENFQILAHALGEKNPLKLRLPEGAYAYPFYCENGMALKRRLAQQKIFVPTLWPNVLSWEGTMEKDYAENILSLPCDQRYGEAQMQRILQALSGQ